MAKLFAAEASHKVVDTALQIHGGYGYMKEYAIERLSLIHISSTQYGRGTQGYYDYEADEQLLAAPVSIADCGDADVLRCV